MPFIPYVLKHSVIEWQVASPTTNILCIHLGSLDTKIIYLEIFQNLFSQASMSLSSSIEFHLQPCSKGSGLHQVPHVCVIPWVSSKLVQGLLSFAHMIIHVMCIYIGCKCLFIVYASCYESFLVSHDVSIYCMMELRTSLHVSILHPKHHSYWTFILGYFFMARRFCINDVTPYVILFFILNCRYLFFRTSLILLCL